MTDTLEFPQPGVIRIIGRSGNTTNAYVKDGKGILNAIQDAVEAKHITIDLLGFNEKMEEIPFFVVIEDIITVMLFPPPSQIALVPPGAHIVDPSQRLQ